MPSLDSGTGEWRVTDSDIRRWGMVVGLVTLVMSGVVTATAALVTTRSQISGKADTGTVQQLARQQAALDVRVHAIEQLRDDVRSLLRLQCATATTAQRGLAGVRCP